MHGLLEQRWLATASHGAALWGGALSTPRTLAVDEGNYQTGMSPVVT